MSRLRARIIGIAIVSACGFTATNMQREDAATSPIDSSVDAYIPDASECQRGSAECIASGQMIRVCDGPGVQPHDEPCSWSCLSTPDAHCGKLVPSGGAVTTADLDPTTLGDITITAAPTATLDTDTGAISGGIRTAGLGTIINGIDVTQRGNVTVFRFNKLTINGVLLRITGTRAAALVSLTDITINAEIDAQGDCQGKSAGPGGFLGGSSGGGGSGSGGGGNGGGADDNCSGGGGGGYGGQGGDGGAGNNNGTTYGSAVIAQLLGGGGGGGGGGQGGEGGGGGGALQLVANGRVTINGLSPLAGGINAGGCGGHKGNSCGGGAGAGGTILIEAPVIDFKSSTLAVNGGGGGGGSDGSDGRDASLNTTSAAGGKGGGGPGAGNSGGDGGDGGDDANPDGGAGGNANRAGGGGGGVGRMRFNTLSGSVLRSGTTVFSPALTTGQQTTTVSTGMAVIR